MLDQQAQRLLAAAGNEGLVLLAEDAVEGGLQQINRIGFGHIAFEVDDVAAVLEKLQAVGGGQIGEQIVADYPNNVVATIVYDTDPEGNIVELQNWGYPITD